MLGALRSSFHAIRQVKVCAQKLLQEDNANVADCVLCLHAAVAEESVVTGQGPAKLAVLLLDVNVNDTQYM